MLSNMVGGRLRKFLKRKRSGGKPTSGRKLFVSPYKRPRTMQMTRMIVPVGRGPVPQSTIITLRYNLSYTTDGTNYDTRFNLNSIYAPLYGVTTHQPLGRDQYATFYNRYRVTKCKSTVICGGTTSYTGSPVKLITVADNDATLITNLQAAQEQRSARITMSTASNFGPIRQVRYHSPAQICGVDSKGYEDDRFQALMTASPTEDIVLHVIISDLANNLQAGPTVAVNITLEYTVTLYDPLTLGGS